MFVSEPAGVSYNFDPLSHRVIGAALEVHRRLGPGFREELYENALHIELEKQGLPFDNHVVITVCYDGQAVGDHQLDLVVEGTVVVELKAVSCLLDVHRAQLLAYLRAANLRVGLLLNFGQLPLGIHRVVNGYQGWPASNQFCSLSRFRPFALSRSQSNPSTAQAPRARSCHRRGGGCRGRRGCWW
jgi:GxxExxY protein